MDLSQTRINDLQPSQFYLSEKKLAAIEGWLQRYGHNETAIPFSGRKY